MSKKILLTGVLLILFGIILGAFGAHALKNAIDDQDLLDAFETGVRYQMYHGLALLILGVSKFGASLEKVAYRIMLIGVVLFSGSIYLLVLNPIIDNVLPSLIGIVTPIGGTLLIIAWILVFFKILKEKLI